MKNNSFWNCPARVALKSVGAELSHLLGLVQWFSRPKHAYFLFFLLEKVVGGSRGCFALILEDQDNFLEDPSIWRLVVLFIKLYIV